MHAIIVYMTKEYSDACSIASGTKQLEKILQVPSSYSFTVHVTSIKLKLRNSQKVIIRKLNVELK